MCPETKSDRSESVKTKKYKGRQILQVMSLFLIVLFITGSWNPSFQSYEEEKLDVPNNGYFHNVVHAAKPQNHCES